MCKINREAKVIYASFFYFSSFLGASKKNNEEVSPEIKKLFKKVARIIKMYDSSNFLEILLKDLKVILKDYPNEKVDLLLASVTILIEYYEQTRGKKRLFAPISMQKAVDLQCVLVDGNDSYATQTFNYCSLIVKGLLNG